MDTILATVILTLCIGTVLFVLFRWIKMPVYRTTRERLIKVLEMVITGQATENEWQILMAVSIRHDETLEKIRFRCLEIEEAHYIGERRPPYLFSEPGLAALREVLDELRQYQPE